ncbi:MAG: hypothetical protein K6F35_05855 [Lachnospiraceae bacterium]|nr:hypothetical protein [Lachnospiraceae bacterium]
MNKIWKLFLSRLFWLVLFFIIVSTCSAYIVLADDTLPTGVQDQIVILDPKNITKPAGQKQYLYFDDKCLSIYDISYIIYCNDNGKYEEQFIYTFCNESLSNTPQIDISYQLTDADGNAIQGGGFEVKALKPGETSRTVSVGGYPEDWYPDTVSYIIGRSKDIYYLKLEYEGNEGTFTKNPSFLHYEDFHGVILPYDSELRPKGKEDLEIKTYWDFSLLEQNTNLANYQLSLVTLALARNAYKPDRIEGVMDTLGINDNFNSYQDPNGDVYHPMAYYGYEKATIKGISYNIFCVSIKGSSNLMDFSTDVNDGPIFFKNCMINTRNDLIRFMEESTGAHSLDELKNQNNIFLIAGHSLGGATANLLAVNVTDFANPEKIFCYTFEPPHTCTELDLIGVEVIPHNFINERDWVTDMPPWHKATTYGHNIKFDSLALDSKIYEELFEVNNDPFSLYQHKGVFRFHTSDNDLAYLMQAAATLDGIHPESVIKRIIRVKCPVYVNVYHDGNLISSTKEGEESNLCPNLAYSVVNGNDKYVFLYDDSEFDIEVVGTGEGKMDYEVFQEDTADGMSFIKGFSSVKITEGKCISSTIDNSVSSCTLLEDTVRLFVVDPEKPNSENNIKEIYIDGSEKSILKPDHVSMNQSEYIYTGEEIIPSISVTVSGNKLTENQDYILKCSNNIRVGTAELVVEGMGDYVGSVSRNYTIISNNPSNPDQPDNPNDPDMPEYDDGDNGIKPGDLPPGMKQPEGIWIGGLQKKYAYTGSAIKPDFRVYYGDKRLAPKLDYTVSYKKNTNPGTDAQVVLTFKGDFTGKKTAAFEIEKNPLSPGTVSADALFAAYKKGRKNNAVKPVLAAADGTVLKYTNKDFELEYKDAKTGQASTCETPGDYIVHMTAKSGSRGYASGASIDVPLTVIDGKPVMSGVKAGGSLKVKFTGEKALPALTLKYAGQTLDSKNYSVETVSGDNYADPGSHILILRGDGVNVFGTKRITYKITGKRKLDDSKYAAVMIDPAGLDAEGQAPYAYGGAKPEIVVSYNGVRLKKGRDYTVSYRNNKKAGNTASLTVKGIGGYAGTVEKEFKVSQRDLKDLILVVNDRAESGREKDYEKTPIMFFTKDGFADQRLKKSDYTAVFTVSSGSTAPKAGDTVSVNIAAKSGGNYTGEASAEFRIIKGTEDLGKAAVAVNKGKAFGYTGKEIRPAGGDVEVKLKGSTVSPEKYELIYFNNVERGSAAVWIKGKNGCGGGRVVRFKIGGSKAADMWDGVIQAVQNMEERTAVKTFRPVWRYKRKAA